MTLEVQSVPIAELHLDPANVRRHPERNLDAIKASLARFGQQRPIIVDSAGIVRAGNGTLEAAKALGWDRIDTIVSDLKGSEMTAYAIVDNRTAELAEWDDEALALTLRSLADEDFDLGELGFTEEEIDLLGEGSGGGIGEPAEDPGPQIDRAEELREKWGTALGQLWLIPSKATPGREHRLLCGDSTKAEDVARVMGGEKAAAIITDPPYGVDFVRGQYLSDPTRKAKTSVPASIEGDDRKGDKQREFIRTVFAVAIPHAAEGASVYVFTACLVEGCCSYFGLLDAGINVQSQLIWNKNVHCLGQADYHWKHEVCWYGWIANGSHRWYGERDKFTVIDCARVQSTLHPNEKPTEIIEGFLDNSTQSGDVVHEPFGGSGTTIVACESGARICRAMELDPKFVAVILERLTGLGLEPYLAD